MVEALVKCRCGAKFKRERNFMNHRAENQKVCKPVPKNQKKKLSVCPHCKQKFYYWQYASIHSTMFKHYGDYNAI